MYKATRFNPVVFVIIFGQKCRQILSFYLFFPSVVTDGH